MTAAPLRRSLDGVDEVAKRRVTVYTAAGCSLCGPALAVVRQAQRELGFSVDVRDITGDPALEAAYRELIPVVEIDGERAFTYVVSPAALRRRLA